MDDSRIIKLYWSRSEQAIPATAEKYANYLSSIAQNILGNREDVEECLNDTYWRAWNAMPPHRPNILSVFLGKITRNLSFNRYKQRHAEKRGGSELTLVLEELSECVSGKEDIAQEVERYELLNEINIFLSTLSETKREVFIRRYWYVDSVANIAKCFGKTENNVSVLLSRIRNDLKKYLRERGLSL